MSDAQLMTEDEAVSQGLTVRSLSLPKCALFSELPGRTNRARAIWVLRQLGVSYNQIAEILGISKSTVIRIAEKESK